MGRQNDAFVGYLNRDEILADLYNGCLYEGEEVILPGQLSEVQKNYSRTLMNYGRNGLRKHRERDADRQHRIFKSPKADGSVDSGRYACDLPWRGGVECAKEAE